MKKTGFLYISLMVLSFNYSKAQPTDTLLCGSVNAYLQTKHWEDLPGCNGGFKVGQNDWDSAPSLLSYSKTSFYNFYKLWSGYKFDPDDLLSAKMNCTEFRHSGATEAWENDKILKEASPLYQAEADKVNAIYEKYTVSWKPTLSKIFQSYFYCETNVKLIDKSFEEAKGKKQYSEIASGERSVLSAMLANMKEALKEADEKKIAGTFIIPGDGDIKDATIDQIKQVFVKKWEAASNSANAKAKEAYEAELAPFLKLLSGDKAKEFRDWYGFNFYGYNGKLLKTPEEIAASPVWFRVGYPPCTICPRWELSGVKFNGMSKTGYMPRKSGYGSDPPANEYK